MTIVKEKMNENSVIRSFSYSKLIKFTLPTIAMMIFTSIYGVVDGVFVSNCVGSDAFAAVNLIMPIIMILGSVRIYDRNRRECHCIKDTGRRQERKG